MAQNSERGCAHCPRFFHGYGHPLVYCTRCRRVLQEVPNER